jgi:hypothetical protein
MFQRLHNVLVIFDGFRFLKPLLPIFCMLKRLNLGNTRISFTEYNPVKPINTDSTGHAPNQFSLK